LLELNHLAVFIFNATLASASTILQGWIIFIFAVNENLMGTSSLYLAKVLAQKDDTEGRTTVKKQ